MSTMNMSIKQVGFVILSTLLLLQFVSVPVVSAETQDLEFVMAYGFDIGELNPVFRFSGRSHWYHMLVYDTLLSYDDDMDLIPWLAEAYSVSADGLTVTFWMRENATWHDGVPLTSEDVKFTFEHIRDGPSYTTAWPFLQHVTSVTAVGNIVTVTLDEVLSFALHTLGDIYILPKHIREGIPVDDNRWDDEDDIVAHTGSGPFIFTERVPDEYTILEKNADWWGPDNPHVGQLPNIDTVKIEVILGQDNRILAMRTGTADTQLYDIFGPYVDDVLSYPELQLVTGVASRWDYIWGFNLTTPGLDDGDVRTALSLAIGRTGLISYAAGGYGRRTDSVIPEVFYPSYFNPNSVFSENITAANDILDSAGYIDLDDDGIRNFPGDASTELEFDLMVLSWDDISVLTGDEIRNQMAAIDVRINVIVMDDGPMYFSVYTGAYEMYTMSHEYTPIPDHVWWRCHSSNIYDWGDNVYHLDDSTVDSVLDDYMGSIPATLEENAATAAAAISDVVPYVPLFLSDDTHILRAEWVNYTTPPGGPFAPYNPRAMVFMYEDPTSSTSSTTSTTTTTSSSTTTTSSTTTGNDTMLDMSVIILQMISAGSIVVIVIVVVLIWRSKNS